MLTEVSIYIPDIIYKNGIGRCEQNSLDLLGVYIILKLLWFYVILRDRGELARTSLRANRLYETIQNIIQTKQIKTKHRSILKTLR